MRILGTGVAMRPRLTVSTYQLDDIVVLRLAGHLTADTLAALRTTLHQLEPVLDRVLDERVPVLVFDLAQVDSCDLSGLAILSAASDAAVQAGAAPRLAGASGPVREFLRESQLGGRVAQFLTVPGAASNDPTELVNG
jgi:anti-anti-sigma regulatory factor